MKILHIQFCNIHCMFMIFNYLKVELMCVWLFVGAAWHSGMCRLCVVLWVQNEGCSEAVWCNLGEHCLRYFGFATSWISNWFLVAAHSETPHHCHCAHGLRTHLHNPAHTFEVACPSPLTQSCTHGWGSCALYFGVDSSPSFWGLPFNSSRTSSKCISK